MIRPIIIILGIFVFWVLFLSGFDKRHKVLLCLSTMLLIVGAIIFDSWSKTPRTNADMLSQILTCDVSVEHSYRTSYNIDICLQNTADKGVIKRVKLKITAKNCAIELCPIVQSVIRDIPIELPASSTVNVRQNLAFDQVDPDSKDIQWSVSVMSLKSIN